MTTLQPIEDHVLVKPIEQETKTASGIVLPDSSKEKPSRGEIIAVGQWKILENGNRGPIDVKPGQIIHFTKYAPDEIEITEWTQKSKYLVIKHSSILAVEK